MATEYMVDESLGFCIEYFSLYKHCTRQVWDPEEETRDNGQLLMDQGKNYKSTKEQLEFVHDYVIKHSVHTLELLR